MSVHLHEADLPANLAFGSSVAVDTETLGLRPHRDRLCLVQLSSGDGSAHLVRVPRGGAEAPNLRRLLEDRQVTKIFHYGRFDIAVLRHALGVVTAPVYCTKIASRLTRTYTDRHGLKDILRELLAIEISKQQQSSDWGASQLSDAQQQYAAADVLHLHALKERFDVLLEREGRAELARACFEFLPRRAELDLLGWENEDIFAHS